MIRKSRLRLPFAVAGLLVVVLVALPTCNSDLTAPPTPGGVAVFNDELPLSVITLNARVPVATLQELAEKEIPHMLVNEERRERWKGKFLGIKTSVSADVMLRVERRGKPTVKFNKDELRLQVPLKFKARIKFRGGVRPNTSSHGRFTVEARLKLGINPDWKPNVHVEGGYVWDKKPRIGSGPISVDISEVVGEQLDKAIGRGAEKLEESLEEDLQLRKKAQKAWRKLQQPKQLSKDGPVWLLVKPESIHLQPLHRDGEDVRMAFALAARLHTLLGELPAQGEEIPLPNLSPSLPAGDGFVIDIPVSAGYAPLEKLLMKKAAGRRIDLSGGELQVTDTSVYGSNGRLVIGAGFTASVPWRLLDTQGRVWVMGRPEYDPVSESLVVRDLDFTRRVNNPLVWTASWVLQDRLRSALRQRSVFPLHEEIAEARADLLEEIQELGDEEWKIDGSISELGVVAIEPLADRLYLRLRTRGHISGEWIPEELSEDSPQG